MEDRLIALCVERDTLEGEFARFPLGAGKSLKERNRKSEVEARLEQVRGQGGWYAIDYVGPCRMNVHRQNIECAAAGVCSNCSAHCDFLGGLVQWRLKCQLVAAVSCAGAARHQQREAAAEEPHWRQRCGWQDEDLT